MTNTGTREQERLACIIAGRNLGDIVLTSTFVGELIDRGYAAEYIVWTRPQMRFLFREFANCEVFESPFPVGTAKGFGLAGARAFMRSARAIRKRRVSVSVDLVGDVRERWFARLAGSTRHLQLGWARDHPFRSLIRNPLGDGRPALRVPADVPNIYSAAQLLLDHLAPTDRDSGGMLAPYARRHASRPVRVGLHPFASQPNKLWPDESWRQLAARLAARSWDVVAFAAPGERERLSHLFGDMSGGVTLFTAGVEEFATAVAALDLLVGLDSFAVHVARRQGVSSIMINAGNPAELWAVPGGQTIARSGGCAYYPCFNRAPCVGTKAGNVCVRSISVEDVMAALDVAANKYRSQQPATAPV